MVQYRVPILEQYAFQPPVIDRTHSDAPEGAGKGDRYIVKTGTTSGDPWEGHVNHIAWYDGAAWQFDTPSNGWVTYDLDTKQPILYEDAAWVVREGDMLKSVYDTNNNGIVDKAENVDDGAGNATSAAQVKESYTRRAQYDSDLKALTFEI